jgi:hypothetical protein
MSRLGPRFALHGNGWDEILMVAVGLIAAYLIVTLTGKKSRAPENADADADGHGPKG